MSKNGNCHFEVFLTVIEAIKNLVEKTGLKGSKLHTNYSPEILIGPIDTLSNFVEFLKNNYKFSKRNPIKCLPPKEVNTMSFSSFFLFSLFPEHINSFSLNVSHSCNHTMFKLYSYKCHKNITDMCFLFFIGGEKRQ